MTTWRSPIRLTVRPAAGFSLIEVLIGVVVLALGLLGIGAVFPVVLRQQRQAQDTVMGIGASNVARSYFTGRPSMRDTLVRVADNIQSTEKGWTIPDVTAAAGDLTLDQGPGYSTVFVPVSERLAPQPFAGGIEPQYVWDVAIRRRPDGVTMAAVFTRRIDGSIRVPVNYTLSNVLTGASVPSNAFRVPVAVDSQGRPTYTGADEQLKPNYAQLFTIKAVQIAQNAFKGVIPLAATTLKARRDLVRQIDQKIVDNLGNVYTVIEVSDEQPFGIKVDPPLSAEAKVLLAAGNLSFVAAPQVPAAVTVLEITR